jgi:acetamidase/formamidase
MQRILREQARKYAFDWEDEPLLRRAGETFEIETYDASTGYFKTAEDKAIPGRRPGFDRVPPHANPIGGPVFLEGAERGDALVITIESITVDDYSWLAIGPRRGPLGESTRWSTRWERRSKDRGRPNQIIGWQGESRGSTLEPPEYQRLAGAWREGRDPARGNGRGERR